jgi:hypothetical protein
MNGACGVVESKTGLRLEIIEGLTHIAGCWKWSDHRSLMEIGHELTRLTLDGESMTDELPGQEAYGAFGQGFKTALASTFERLRGVFPEDCHGVSNWKERIDAAEKIARDALGVIRHLALTLDLVDSVNFANRLIVEEAIGRGMVVWWMEPGGERAFESAVFSVFGRSGAYVADERGISYSEAACNEVAELIFDSKKPADLRPVGKIEFDCSEAEREISCRRERLNNNGREQRNGKEQSSGGSQ